MEPIFIIIILADVVQQSFYLKKMISHEHFSMINAINRSDNIKIPVLNKIFLVSLSVFPMTPVIKKEKPTKPKVKPCAKLSLLYDINIKEPPNKLIHKNGNELSSSTKSMKKILTLLLKIPTTKHFELKDLLLYLMGDR
jgi:uncharacterized membrane protein